MSKSEMETLINETKTKIETIQDFVKEIESNRNIIESTKETLLNQLTDLQLKKEEIENAYDIICVDDNEGDCRLTSATNALTEIESIKVKINEYNKELFGNKNEAGEVVEGKKDEIDKFYDEQVEKYDTFFKKIEQELNAGTTSAALAKTFADKVLEYKKSSQKRENWFIIGILLIIGLIVIDLSLGEKLTSLADIRNHLLINSPLYIFGVRFIVFIGNRRAETKKLEESYKHKEALARSFVGYRETIKTLDEEDGSLLRMHMENLLKAMAENSGEFLSKEGDKHPLIGVATDLVKSKTKTP